MSLHNCSFCLCELFQCDILSLLLVVCCVSSHTQRHNSSHSYNLCGRLLSEIVQEMGWNVTREGGEGDKSSFPALSIFGSSKYAFYLKLWGWNLSHPSSPPLTVEGETLELPERRGWILSDFLVTLLRIGKRSSLTQRSGVYDGCREQVDRWKWSKDYEWWETTGIQEWEILITISSLFYSFAPVVVNCYSSRWERQRWQMTTSCISKMHRHIHIWGRRRNEMTF